MDTAKAIGGQIPGYLSDAKNSISSTFEYFNSMDAYYLKDDIRREVNIKNLLNSKYSEEVLEGIKFLLGVTNFPSLKTQKPRFLSLKAISPIRSIQSFQKFHRRTMRSNFSVFTY
jgi:hypothetical protein